jgi:hypothetical protein
MAIAGERTPDPVHTRTHTHTYLLEREKNSSCVRVVNEASGIQEGENKVNEGGKRSGFASIIIICGEDDLIVALLFITIMR